MSVAPRFMAAKARPLPVLVLADISGSMKEPEEKIDVLNECIRRMLDDFASADVGRGAIHVGVIAFGGGGATEHQRLVPATEAIWTDMEAFGGTPLGAALRLTRDVLADEAVIPARAFSPTVVLVSDGMPNDDWEEGLDLLLASPRGAKANRLAVAIGGSDMTEPAKAVLRRFVSDESTGVFEAQEVGRIQQYFRWVTVTVTQQARSTRPGVSPVLSPEDLSGFGA
ncbi:vWA domain-containing protein [Streptomyces sp. NBC_00690]|uniref:vWA domain-containing protein n=1 Tax=Streptomyces sp. NBC_00690 TaxID=2975808 RepID=UPI002E28F912|nr:VWA domain-containing protein [Streptomyces sp. NBC_00690]